MKGKAYHILNKWKVNIGLNFSFHPFWQIRIYGELFLFDKINIFILLNADVKDLSIG